jgi:3-isopropylmalate/(R)-2-methylmalate dehydratase large subunit
MTFTEKVIAAYAGRKFVAPRETHFVRSELAMGSEIIFPQIAESLAGLKWNGRIDREKIALINGHLVSTREAAAGTLVAALDKFAGQHQIEQYFQAGRSGDCQSLLADQGLIRPGSLVVGSDQHFTAYGALGALATGVGSVDLASAWTTGYIWMTVPQSVKINLTGELRHAVTPKDLALHMLSHFGTTTLRETAVEFYGDGLERLSMSDRYMLCNMMVETGVQFAVMPVDQITREFYASLQIDLPDRIIAADSDAAYNGEFTFDLGEVLPMVALPYLPTEGVPVEKMTEIEVHQVIIGSCTNGRIEDFRLAAEILNKHEVFPGLKLGMYPSTNLTVRQLVDEGLAMLFTRRGAMISPPSCQACLGAGSSVLGENEVGVYTINRNYKGRHGPASAKVFLSGPLVAAASAVAGVITDPREFL